MITYRYEHQIKTQAFIDKTPYCLIANEMGLGKSCNAIDTIAATKGRCLIVTPACLSRNWQRECIKFADIKASIYPDISSRVVIVSIDIVYKHDELFHNLDVLVLEECHNLNNARSRRSASIHQYVKEYKPKRLLLLSGTPIRGKVTELYSPLLLLHGDKFRRYFPNPWAFFLRYSNKVSKRLASRTITEWVGFKNLDELKAQWLSGIYIKFKLDEVIDLPEVIYEEVILDIKVTAVTKKLDDDMEASGWRELVLGEVPTSTAFASLKKDNAILKATEAIKFIKNELENTSPLVVFSDHLEPVRMVLEGITGAECITGAASAVVRDDIVQRFQAGKIPVLVGTLGAMSTGLNLFASNTVIFIDKSIIPSINMQAVGRIKRIGQKRRCRVIVLHRDGLDLKINALLRTKELLIERSGL